MIEHYRRALASNSLEPVHYYNLAAALHAKGKSIEALDILKQGISVIPSDARLHYGFACIQQDLGMYSLAQSDFTKATHIDPGFADAWYGLGSSYQSIGDTQRAADCYKKVLSLVPDHAIARHLLASLSGNTTDSPEPVFVEQLFDHYAERYEQHLLGELQYKGHTLVASALRTFLQQQDQNRVLDLGCGTGLFGAEIAPLCSRLVGIDLSSEMIKHAKGRGCYEELRVIDLLKFMKQSPPSTYDIVASVDVFSYLGDLNPAFKAVHRILKSGGLFAFTVEAATGTEAAGYRLDKTGRYQHAKAYLNQLAKRYGYEDLSIVLSALRSENRSACEAWVCIWRKWKIPVSND